MGDAKAELVYQLTGADHVWPVPIDVFFRPIRYGRAPIRYVAIRYGRGPITYGQHFSTFL